MTRHDLKVHPQFWPGLLAGNKRFELRRNDRGFKVGDELCLHKYDPTHGMTGARLTVRVTYMLLPEDCPGLMAGFCILGISYEIG